MCVWGIEQSTDVKQIVFPTWYQAAISVEVNVKAICPYSLIHAPPNPHYIQRLVCTLSTKLIIILHSCLQIIAGHS